MVSVTQGSSVDTTSTGKGNVNIPLEVPQTVGQGTFTPSVNTNNIWNGHLYNSTTADGDNCSWQVFLSAGTYRMDVLFVKDGTGGIIDFELNSTEIASLDTYNSSTTRNNVDSTTDITVTEGLQTFKITVDGKNASASDYAMYIQAITLTRTA